MKMSLRVRLLGTIVGAIVLFFLISLVATRITLQHDLLHQGELQVTNSAGAFGGYWDSHRDQIRLLVAQDAVADALRKSLENKNYTALQNQLSNVARTSGLSFLAIVDAHGNVIARANGANRGSMSANTFVQRALTGETVTTAAILPASELKAEGLAPQAASDIKNAAGATVEHLTNGLAIVAAAPMADQNQRTIGAIYGGILMNHFYDIVDQTTHALAGSAALMDGNAIIASSILAPDGTRVTDTRDSLYAKVQNGTPYTGSDVKGGTKYLVHIEPIENDQNETIGARWYGIPMSQINDIINHLTESLLIWGLIAMIVALALAIPIVQRLSLALARRAQQVSAAAKELGVAIVGSEVSGDHVAATKAAVEKSGAIIDRLASHPSANGEVKELKALNDELSGDMIVIDTLSQEMSSRMQQAVERVHELNDVAGGLKKLVTGEAS